MLTLVKETLYEEDIKKSRFIVKAARVSSPEEAFSFLERIKEEQANHNCWAYKIGQNYRFSDDGEPSGCAGRPMLNVLQGSGIGEITVVVSRYFGGIKLGTGGMARAYGAAVSAVLAQAVTVEKKVNCQLSFCCDYQWTNLVELLVKQYHGVITSANYLATIEYQIEIDVRQRQQFIDQLNQRSHGQITITLND